MPDCLSKKSGCMHSTQINYGKGTKNIANTEEDTDSGNLIEMDCNW